MKIIMKDISNKRLAWFVCICLVFFTGAAAAAGLTLGGMASSITSSFTAVGKFLMGISYVVGIALVLAGLAKLKAHKDSPTQVPASNGIVLILIGASLLFLPTLLNVTSYTMFGPTGGSTAGPSGITFGS